MNKVITILVTLFVLATSPSLFAIDVAKYTSIVNETVHATLQGGAIDVDALISKQKQLIALGVAGCKERASSNPEDSDVMNAIVANATTMQSMSLDEIEDAWHDFGYLKSKGIDPESRYEHFAAVISLMDSVIHPATAVIALQEYKKDGDSDHLDQVRDELSEVLEHIKHVN